MLKDQLYSLKALESTDNSITAQLALHANDAIYQGHFPGNPVTPGVVQLEIIKELLAHVWNSEVTLVSMATAKYLAILNPLTTPAVEVQLTLQQQEDQTWKVAAVFKSETETFTKVSGVYGCK